MRFFICLITAGLILSSATDSSARGFTPEDLAKMQWVGEVAMAPDGSRIAFTRYVQRNPFTEDNGPMYEELYLVTLTGETTPFITGKVNVSAIAWHPDGVHLSFLDKREGDKKKSLYLISTLGGEARKLIELSESISEYAWLPDGRSVALVAKEPPAPNTTRLRELGFDMEVFEEDYRHNRLYLFNTTDTSAKPEQIEIPGSVSAIRVSPDGNYISMTVAPTSLVDHRYTSRDIVVYDVASRTVALTIDTPGKLGDFAWSPDSRSLAFVTAEDKYDPKEGLLAIQDIGSESGYRVITDDAAGHVTKIAWLNNSELVFMAEKGVTTPLAKINREGNARETLFDADSPVPVAMSFSEDMTRVAFRASTPTHPDEVFYFEPGGSAPSRLTVSNPWLDDITLGRQEVITYEARDGLEIQGLLIYPPDYTSGTRYPLLEVVHGGPESRMANDWLTWYSYPGQMAAARGYVVFYPNYRGSLGRGIAFSKMGQRDYGGGEFNDLVDAITHLANIGLIDRERVAITGRSYGGFASNWAATALTDHFNAAVAICGASNQTSKFGTTDIPEEMYLVHARQWPWENWQWYLERSPIYHAEQSKTPLLLIHGEKDTRVPPSQAIELYRHLKIHGQAPVRLVLYPDEPHGTRDAAGRYDITKRALRWIDWYIKGTAEGLPPVQPDYSGLQSTATVTD